MKHKMKVIFGLLFFCGILAWGFGVSAATIFTDSFESYNAGMLHGQGGWWAPHYLVSAGQVKEGTKSVSASSSPASTTAFKSGALLNDGQITVYVRRFDANQPGIFSFILREGAATKIEVRGNFGAQRKFQYIDGATGSYVNFGPEFNFEQWYGFQIQWRSSDHSARYNVDGGSWTNWAPGIAPWTSGLDTVQLETINAMTWDAIQENLIDFRDPVLVVPGLLGTEIKGGDELLWADVPRMVANIGDSFMDLLMFKSDVTPNNTNLELSEVIRQKPFFNYTDALIGEFIAQGYVENENLFTFPYDWRYGVTGKYANGKTNVDLLKQKVADIMAQTGAQKVDIIAHSMGGLIVKKYVVDNLASHHIGKTVFVGVPSTGAPKSIKVLLQGDNFGVLGLNDAEMKRISANMPAAYDLLPSQQYYNTKGSYVKVVDQGNLGAGPVTIKELNYSEANSFLTDDHQLNSTAMAQAEILHTQSFDNFDMRTAGVDLYSINGCKTPTISNIVESRAINIFGQKIIDYKALKWGSGDKTVPLESATNLPINQENKFYSLNTNHGTMMGQDGSRQQIVNIISGSSLPVASGIITQDIADCKLNGKAISVFSPVDIFVTDQQGNELGNAQDGSVLNEIPNAAFEVFGDHKFLYLPTDDGQVYEVKMKGTGAGTYTIKVQEISNTEAAGMEVFSNLPVTADLTGTVNLGSQTTLTVQQNSESAPQTILPSSVITGEAVEDVVAPVSTATLTGTQGQAGFYRSDVNVALAATDDASGVLTISYKVNGGDYISVAPLSGATRNIATEGAHTITFFATDKAGNNEPEKTLNFTIDKTPPEALMQSDPVTKNIIFTGVDNISDGNLLVVQSQGGVTTITDEAGNITRIEFLYNIGDKPTKVELKSIRYNGVLVDISSMQIKFSWKYKNNLLRKFSQEVEATNEHSISTSYKDGKTKISIKDASGKFSEKVMGQIIIKVATKKGELKWSY